MSLFNTQKGYGAATKFLHWLMLGVFAFQYMAAQIMTATAPSGQALGLTSSDWFNWHKSIGLIALAIALARFANRRVGELPPWAPTLSEGERRFIHRAEQVLYAAMLVMPISGFIYVMAGGYGVLLFGRWPLANPVGGVPWLATLAKWVHVGCGWVLLGAVAAHVGLVLKHQFVLKDGLLWRMLPGRRN